MLKPKWNEQYWVSWMLSFLACKTCKHKTLCFGLILSLNLHALDLFSFLGEGVENVCGAEERILDRPLILNLCVYCFGSLIQKLAGFRIYYPKIYEPVGSCFFLSLLGSVHYSVLPQGLIIGPFISEFWRAAFGCPFCRCLFCLGYQVRLLCQNCFLPMWPSCSTESFQNNSQFRPKKHLRWNGNLMIQNHL